MSAQNLLTYLAETVLISSIALYTALFLDGLMKRNRPVPGQLEIDFSAAQPQEPEPIAPVPPAPPAPEQPRLEIVILPFRRPSRKPEHPQAIDLEGLTIRQLKAIASRLRMPRYNVCTKAQLQARLLEEVPADRLAAALAEVAAAA
ncbi:hypothetical protein [Leptolyngbya ohadii]|uniref:hypothetical protein n=1 Tax=Leptolyngbya ohadii TaxID=1962290 RepID=UPI000B59AA39|nr:hypothetical protein [Leptolyngbya ohadii]